MLKFHGHAFKDTALCQCCVGDKRVGVVDPTNTGSLRGKFRSAMRMRWNNVRVLVKKQIVDADALTLKNGGLTAATHLGIMHAGPKIDVFQRWLDMALANVMLSGDGGWMRMYLDEAYSIGTAFGQLQARTAATVPMASHRQSALLALARVELQGVAEAVSQQIMRAVANGVLTQAKPMAIARKALNVIEKVGVNRANAMIELLVVRAHAEASLDIYAAAGLARVGLLPESRAQARVVTDAKAQPKAKAAAKDAKRTGPGSRVSRTRTPSSSTIGRIRSAELSLARRLGENVNVRTAGDDDVCPVCEGISEDGPYGIDEARSLIPAHAHCRCVFVPAEDDRFATDALRVVDYNENHDPGTGQFSSGGGGGGGSEISHEEFTKLAPDWSKVKKGDRRKIMINATENWFGAGYEDVNHELRTNSDWHYGAHQRNIRGLDRAFEDIGKNMHKDAVVYRGVNTDHEDPFKIGAEFEDKGFSSTSHHKSTALNFVGEKGVLLHINVKKGTRVYVPELPEDETGESTGAEPEILLNRGSRFRVTSRHGNNVHVDLL